MEKYFSLFLSAFLLICLLSCNEQSSINTSEKDPKPKKGVTQFEQYEPGVAGITEEFSDGNSMLRFTNKNGVYSSGDIIFTQEQIDKFRKGLGSGRNARTAGLANYSDLWQNGVVFYTIDPNLPNQSRVTDAINHWEQRTGITFVLRTNQTDYVRFVPGNGCSSYLGRRTGVQDVTLGLECTTGIVIHEIGHVVGLFHEMARTDRDDYITINYNNIEIYNWDQFNKYTSTDKQGFQLNSFDWTSIMLYGSYNGSKNGSPAMTRKNGTPFEAQRDGLSPSDTYVVNRMYFNARTRIRSQTIEDYTDGGGNQILTVDNYLEFFADDAYSVPLTLNKLNHVPIRVYNRNGSVNAGYVAVPAGTQSYFLGRTTSSCHYNQYGEVDGECYTEGIGLEGGWH